MCSHGTRNHLSKRDREPWVLAADGLRQHGVDVRVEVLWVNLPVRLRLAPRGGAETRCHTSSMQQRLPERAGLLMFCPNTQKKDCRQRLRERWDAERLGSAAELERRLAGYVVLGVALIRLLSHPSINLTWSSSSEVTEHGARRLDAQQPEAPSKREMLTAVHQIGRKKASVDAVMSALLAGVAGPAASTAANDYTGDLQHAEQPQAAQTSQPLSLEAHIQAHQVQLPGGAGPPAAPVPPTGPPSWKRRFWELHRELREQRDGELHGAQLQTQRWQPPTQPQQPYAAPVQPGHHLAFAGLAPDASPVHAGAATQHAHGTASSVVPFRPAATPPKRGGLGGPDDPDPRPVVLFDLNGTLTSHTASRRSAGTNKMRPGTPLLRRLKVCAGSVQLTRFVATCPAVLTRVPSSPSTKN